MPSLAARRYDGLWAPLVAAALAALAIAAAVRGVDLPAALYRVELFHSSGLTLWDNQWYGGHWTLNYSVLFPPIAGTIGLGAVRVLSAALAAWAFDRLVVESFGRRARIGSLLFAVWTLAQVAQAQLPFLLGEAFGLVAFLMLRRQRWAPAIGMALASTLASPLAGAFLALAALVTAIAEWPRLRARTLAVGAAALVPVGVLSVLFPGQGAEAFPPADLLSGAAVPAVALLWLGRHHRPLRIGLAIYLVAIVVAFVVPTPVGGNITRLEECIGAPLIACLVACGLAPTDRRVLRPMLAGALFVALIPLQWGPAIPSLFGGGDPSRSIAYYQPLISYLRAHDATLDRVEVVPTQWHWEAAYVAPVVPLARGWERQLDTANNPLFYGQAPLTAASYRAWLAQNGVRYVALPDTTLDMAAQGEARLVRAGVPGLRQVWHRAHWRVYAVTASPGIVSGPARLSQWGASALQLVARAPGRVVVRVRYSANWDVTAGRACIAQAPGGWIALQTRAAGPVTLGVSAFGTAQRACAT